MKASANLEYVRGTSNKFWTIAVDGKTVSRTWGRKGTKGQGKVDTFPTEQQAATDYARRLREQFTQGYLQVESVTADPSTTLNKIDGKRTLAWSIRQDGHKLYISLGAIGSSSSRQSIPMPSKDEATAEYKRRVSEKLADGYQTVTTAKPSTDETEVPASGKSDKVTNPAGKSVRRLTGKRAVVIGVDYGEIDRFVQEMTGQDFYFVADQECGNDSDHEINADGEVDDYDREDVEKFIATGKGSYLSSRLLNYFVSKGWLEAGTYLIRVCW